MALEERPGGAGLIEAAEGKAFEQVVVYRLDRLSRDTLKCLLAIERLKGLGIPVVSVDELTPSVVFVYWMLGSTIRLFLARQRDAILPARP